MIEFQKKIFTNKIKTLINKDFNSIYSDLISRVKPLQDAKTELNKKIIKDTTKTTIPDVNIQEIISARELKSTPHYFDLIHESGSLLKLSADEIAKIPKIMQDMIYLHRRCKREFEELSRSYQDTSTTQINFYQCVKLEKNITKLIEEIEVMKISCETLSHFKWLKEK